MKIRSFARRMGGYVAIAAYVTLSGCGDGTAPLVPSTVQVVAGDQQVVTAATAVPVIPSVKVLATNGKPVPGVNVTFVATAGSGTVVGGTQVTDATGVARITSWTVGTKAGPNTLTVTAEGLAPVTITANTNPAAPTQIAIQQGDVQSGTVGAVLTVQPAIRVSDAYGNAVANVSVSFTVSAGSVQTAQTQTDATGVASAGNWTLGTRAGTQWVTATANVPALSNAPVTLTATAAPDAASKMTVVVQPSPSPTSGQRFAIQPAVEFSDRFDNTATSASNAVTVTLASGSGTLGGTTTVVARSGRANFTDLSYTGVGAAQLRFTANGFTDATSSVINAVAVAQCAGTSVDLNMALGGMTRFATSASTLPRCLEFSRTRNAGQQYLLMFENVSPRGSYSTGAFPGPVQDDGALFVALSSGAAGQTVTVPQSSANSSTIPAEAIEGWSFGGQTAYEVQPRTLTAPPATVKRNGEWISTESSSAALGVGDTLRVQLEGIPRLSIPTALRLAVVRLVSADIVIAEDVRLADPTFTRGSGARNTPIADADLQQIAAEYAAYAKLQADRLFNGRYNGATEQEPGRPIAVHTLMWADNIWGYTYSSTNYFAWDYWVNSADGRTKDVFQHVQRNSDNLFMHEIAHMRHYGMLERAGRTGARGNQWLVEGFARFTERLPIANRLLGAFDFSRTANVVLPYNPAMTRNGQQVYFRDDVPTYLNAGTSMYGGYESSAWIFDYFSDQVAKRGGNWTAALQEFLVAAGVQSDLDAVVNRYLPGLDFATLLTRARLALYLDDIGTPGLPEWTQFWQYQLRASRPAGTLSTADPRNLWPVIRPGTPYTDNRNVDSGGAFGYLIDGAAATGDARIELNPTRAANGVFTLVRIK